MKAIENEKHPMTAADRRSLKRQTKKKKILIFRKKKKSN